MCTVHFYGGSSGGGGGRYGPKGCMIPGGMAVKGWLNQLNFKGKTNRLKEMLIFTILANFVYFPCISDRNLIILLKLLQKLPCA